MAAPLAKPGPAIARRGLRADAAANRASLIAAAGVVMREHGGDVPLEAIAERAGTTRGTMYRNFADRRELYLAVLEDDLRTITERLARRRKMDLMAVMEELSDMMAVYDRFLASLPDLAEMGDFSACQSRIFVLIDAPLKQAQDQGRVRRDVTSADILVTCRMIAAGWQLDGARSRKAALGRRVEIILRGLESRCVS